MPKDYAKFVPVKSVKPKGMVKARRYTLGLMLAVGVLASLAYVRLTPAPNFFARVHEYKVNTLVAKALALLNHKFEKHSVQPTDDDALYTQPVKFAFYDELPRRQANVAPQPLQMAKQDQTQIPVTKTAKPQVVAALAKSAQPNLQKIFSAEHITEKMAEDLGTRYFVQLGAFESKQAAKKLTQVLASVGFASQINKTIKHRAVLYQVTQGPFNTPAMAQAKQQALKKRGINSIIQKLA